MGTLWSKAKKVVIDQKLPAKSKAYFCLVNEIHENQNSAFINK